MELSTKNDFVFVWTWVVDEAMPSQHKRADHCLLAALQGGLGTLKTLNNNENTEVFTQTFNRSAIKSCFDQKRVKRNDATLKAHQHLRPGEKLSIWFRAFPKTELTNTANTPESKLPLVPILYEDEHILVINKPPSLTVHPCPSQPEGTLVHCLLAQKKQLSPLGGALRPGIVHRLDKNTSGALILAKSDLAQLRLVETFSQHAIGRSYWALVYGTPLQNGQKNAEGSRGKESHFHSIESWYGRNPKNRKQMSMKVSKGKKAITLYRVLERYALRNEANLTSCFASWIEAELKTGRTHQVRVHLTGLGNSLLGDQQYGTVRQGQNKWKNTPPLVQAKILELPGQALHARQLKLLHPISKEELCFQAEPFLAFEELHKNLKNYVLR